MLFKSKQKKESLNINLVINNCEIKQVNEIVFLGVILDEHLSWKHMPEITESAFKTRYNNHTNSFQNPKHKNSTALSKYIWKLKDSKIIKNCRGYSSHTKNCRGYSSHTKKCSSCLDEKYIICHQKVSLLNSRNELVSTCRLRKKISSFLGIIIRRDNHHRKQICSD